VLAALAELPELHRELEDIAALDNPHVLTTPPRDPVAVAGDAAPFGVCDTCHARIEYLGRTLLGGLGVLDADPAGARLGGTVVDLVGCPTCRRTEATQVYVERRLPQEISHAERQEWAEVDALLTDWRRDTPDPWERGSRGSEAPNVAPRPCGCLNPRARPRWSP
jgi:hypothetical protein